jgi:peptidoglycan/LPS O-acetylase OafA/YrhL
VRSFQPLARVYSPRANGIGFLRLALACAVFVAHCGPLGVGRSNIGDTWTRGQVEFGSAGVYGFFVLSGFLVTASARRTGVGRFLWHRALRIYPGLWACLLVTALVLGPLLYRHDHGTTAGYWNAPQGPLGYLVDNWGGGLRQFGLSGLFTGTPYGREVHASVVDGSLWTLSSELCCYAAVAVLAFTGVLLRAPRLVLVLAAWAYLVLLGDFVAQAHDGILRPGDATHPRFGPLPLLGVISLTELVPLLLMFLLGAAFQLYADRVPMHPLLGCAAGAVVLATAFLGGFMVVGLPVYAYLLLAVACYLPRVAHRVGRRHDYSYGVYIYAFPAQQVTAQFLGVRWHLAGFAAVALALTAACAVLSWHVVEHPMLKLKDIQPFPVYGAERRTLAPVASGRS